MGSAIQEDLFGHLCQNHINVGVDEVGRGCIAGPVVACACFSLGDCELPKVYDSKALSVEVREELFIKLSQLRNFYFAFGVVSSEVVDEINILQATFTAMRQALDRLPRLFDHVLVDGSLTIPGISYPQRAIVKGDAKEPLISAASILAKVYRDKLMDMYDKLYPSYGFSLHKGYGTAMHLQMLGEHGPTPIHRHSFAPLSKKLDTSDQYFLLEDFFI